MEILLEMSRLLDHLLGCWSGLTHVRMDNLLGNTAFQPRFFLKLLSRFPLAIGVERVFIIPWCLNRNRLLPRYGLHEVGEMEYNGGAFVQSTNQLIKSTSF